MVFGAPKIPKFGDFKMQRKIVLLVINRSRLITITIVVVIVTIVITMTTNA